MSFDFSDELLLWPASRVREWIGGATESDVINAIGREERTARDLAALLSPAAVPHLEAIAQEAHRLTRWHFGRTISLYTPIYLSNVCGADCTYCGYAVRSGNRERRVTLTAPEIHRECEALAAQGFQSVLLLTGEAPRAVPVDYIASGVAIAREYFPSVSTEVYSLDQADYARLCANGLEGVTIYMETYDRNTYAQVHLLGEKADYDYRLGAIERAGRAGARKLTIGALLGLTDWRLDGFWLALHGRYLQRTCWQSSVALSFPRLQHVPERFTIPTLMSDREFVQFILAMRLFLPEAGFNLSTRESPALRDRMIPLGVTTMSAGSSTRPGGYATHSDEVLEQFEVEDHRSLSEVAESIRRAGYDPVWKDFDHAFDEPGLGS
jgi:2-iminoacetate synthase